MSCRCSDPLARFLSLDCIRHEADSHAAWMASWYRANPRFRVEQVPRYPRETFEVAVRCACRGTSRYLSVRCPDVTGHGDPVVAAYRFLTVDPIMVDAAEYHRLIMADADPDGHWTRLSTSATMED